MIITDFKKFFKTFFDFFRQSVKKSYRAILGTALQRDCCKALNPFFFGACGETFSNFATRKKARFPPRISSFAHTTIICKRVEKLYASNPSFLNFANN